MLHRATHALVRSVAGSYAAHCARQGRAVSRQLAESQHAEYTRALEDCGLTVSVVEADESFPDCVFIEDTAVVWDGRALITRMADNREGEQPAIETVLARQSHEIVRLCEVSDHDARLEGGDVLHVGDVTFVGLSSRTNQAGAEALRSFLAPAARRVVSVEVRNCLHLKTGVTYLGDGTLLAVPGSVNLDHFKVAAGIGVDEVIFTADGEGGAANCLRIGDRLLIPAGYPETRERIIDRFAGHRGVRVRPLDISEFEKGDGSLTCLSLLW